MSQKTSVDMVEEAFAVGAVAHIVKADAGRELMLALDAVLRGEKYASKTVLNLGRSAILAVRSRAAIQEL